MLDPGMTESDALTNVVRSILQLQKRQVELYEAQLEILAGCVHVKTDPDISKPSLDIHRDAEVESDLCAVPKADGPAAANLVSKITCKRIAVMPMDDAPQAPACEPVMDSSILQPGRGSAHVSDCFEPDVTATAWLGDCNWEGEDSVKSQFHDELPSDMTAATRNTLIFLGAVPVAVFRKGYGRILYQLYRCFIIASLLLVAITACAGGCLRAWAGKFPVEFVYCLLIGVLAPSMTIYLWQQLGCRGAYMDMFHQLSRRRFHWYLFDQSTYVLWCVIAITEVVLAVCWFALLANEELAPSLPETVRYSSSGRLFQDISRALYISVLPFLMFDFALFCTIVWCFWTFAELHRYDVWNYGSVLASVLENGDGQDHLILMLKRLEFAVTARLRYANRTWIRQGMFSICFQVFLSIVVGTYLFNSDNARGAILASINLIWTCVSSGVVTISMARVAETFEHDVFRVLNNPHVLHKAQRFFGQQLVAHLRGLEWGFRFGGRVINAQFGSRLVASLATTTTITISQSCYSLVGVSM